MIIFAINNQGRMSFYRFTYHIVFATHQREKTIPIEHERELYSIIHHIIKKNGGHLYRINGMPDHIHILVDIPATISVANFIKAIKRESSYLLKVNSNFPKWNGWQEGYGAFTYSKDDIPQVKQYIVNQKVHHQSLSFIDEYRQWLIEMGVSPDEPYFPK